MIAGTGWLNFFREKEFCHLRWLRHDENVIHIYRQGIEGLTYATNACMRYAVCVLQADDEPTKRDLLNSLD